MDLVTPSPGLILWQLIVVLSIVLFIVAWIVILITNKLGSTQKIVWLIGTMFLPMFGPLILFIKYSSFKKASSI